MKLHLDFVLAALLDGFIQGDSMFRQLDLAKLLGETIVNILCRDRAKGFAGLAGFKSENKRKLVDPGRDLLGGGQFTPLAFGAFGSEMIDFAQRARGHLESFPLGDEEIACKATTDFYEIGFRAETGDILRENDFCVCHRSRCQTGGKD